MPTEDAINIHTRLGVLETKMDTLIEQVKKTNGSVASLKMWRAYIVGGISVLSAIVIPLAYMFLESLLRK